MCVLVSVFVLYVYHICASDLVMPCMFSCSWASRHLWLFNYFWKPVAIAIFRLIIFITLLLRKS